MSYFAIERQPHDDEELNSEEEEEERLLSAEHGEAADDGPKRKRPASTTAYSEADAAAAKEFEEKVKAKKSRPTFTPADLKGAKGLVSVRRSFPHLVKFRHHKPVTGTGVKSSTVAEKMNQQSQLNSAASYTRSLVSAYKNFARSLFPSLAPEDVLLKIEDMGSKKEIKDYLQLMRNDVRKDYLEGIYGDEKTERILQELENGISFTPKEEEEYVESRPARRMGEAVLNDEVVGEDIARVANVSNPYEKLNPSEEEQKEEMVPKEAGTDVSDEEDELEFVTDKTISESGEGAATAKVLIDAKIVDAEMSEDQEEFELVSQAKTKEESNATGDNEVADNANNEACVGLLKSLPDAEDRMQTFNARNKIEDSVLSGYDDHENGTSKAHESPPAEDAMEQTNSDVAGASFVATEEKSFAGTQETLTLVASQFGDDASHFGNDEIVDDVGKDHTGGVSIENSKESSQFTLSQLESTADERFSQSNVESSFEVEEQSQGNNVGACMNLGQETQGGPTQLSMDY